MSRHTSTAKKTVKRERTKQHKELGFDEPIPMPRKRDI